MTRKLTLKERKIAALSATLEQEEHAQTPFLPPWVASCNAHQTQFVRRAIEKNLGNIHRNGWPDFLIEEPGGGAYAVEVRPSVGGVITASQEATFAALDSRGIRVYMWTPCKAASLIPWRIYLAGLSSTQGASEEPLRLQDASRDRARERCTGSDRVVNNNETAPKPIRKGAGPRRKYQ